jgi:hypothetical protein
MVHGWTETALAGALLTRVPRLAALGRVEVARLAAHLEPVAVPEGGEVFVWW